jgi:hypothetical protein
MTVTDETLDENTPDRAPSAADAPATSPDADASSAATAASDASDDTVARAGDTASRHTEATSPGAANGADRPQYGVGPFTVREVALGGVWLVAFVVSFFPVNLLLGEARALIGGTNVWVSGLSWILTIGLPTVAVFLIALRRLSPQGIRRVGSLGIDQFASVAFAVSAVLWLSWLWETIAIAIEFGLWARSWVIWVEVVLMLAGVVLTVFAPLLPVLKDDFAGRREVVAHRNARPVRAVTPRPARERPARPARPAAPAPAAADGSGSTPSAGTSAPAPVTDGSAPYGSGPYGSGAYGSGPYGSDTPDSGAYTRSFDAPESADADDLDDTSAPGAYRSSYEPGPRRSSASSDSAPVYGSSFDDGSADDRSVDDTATAATDVFAPLTGRDARDTAVDDTAVDDTAVDDTVATAPAAQQAFWALAPEERDIVDDYGVPMFRIGPTAWALVIEDRGAAFVVRHEDGRIGYLHDVSGITRG